MRDAFSPSSARNAIFRKMGASASLLPKGATEVIARLCPQPEKLSKDGNRPSAVLRRPSPSLFSAKSFDGVEIAPSVLLRSFLRVAASSNGLPLVFCFLWAVL